MPALTLDGTEWPVRVTTGSVDYEDRTNVHRKFTGALHVSERGNTLTHARVLTVLVFDPANLTAQQMHDLRDLLEDVDPVMVAGDLWGSPAEAEARDIEWVEGPLRGYYGLSFSLHEVGGDVGSES